MAARNRDVTIVRTSQAWSFTGKIKVVMKRQLKKKVSREGEREYLCTDVVVLSRKR